VISNLFQKFSRGEEERSEERITASFYLLQAQTRAAVSQEESVVVCIFV
jgi:hypothetical protein